MTEFETPDSISVVIELTAGDVRLAASDRSDTVVEVRPSDRGRRIDVTAAEQTAVEYSAGRLLIRTTRRWRQYSPFSDGGAVDVQVALPAGSRVTGEAAIGTFRFTGPLGACRVKTSVGSIHIEQAAAVQLTAATGDVSVERATGDADLSTGSGTLRAGEIDGTAVIRNSNGDSRLGEITGELRVKAANGDITIERAHASLTAKTANGDICVGAAGWGSVVAETGLGGIEIGVPEGTAAWLDLVTRYGHVHNALDAGEPPQPDEATVEVRARTACGDITIRRCHAPARVDSAA
jgi:DUF4097 and DUF4098 domain-containing protein YvlB